MIFDNIKNCKMYYEVNSGFEKAFEFIKKATEEDMESGKYEIDGDRVYGIVQNYESKLMKDSKFEGHEKYIDIQYILNGRELMGVMDISKAVVCDEYNAEKDVAFYEKSDLATYCIVGSGDFCIFCPHDIHSPGVAYDDTPSSVKKIIVKVKV